MTPSQPATPSSCSSSPSVIRVHHAPATDVITRLAVELHIDDFPMMEAQTQTIRAGTINPLTGHMYTSDDIATFHALQPDRPDPPAQPFSGRGFPIRSARTPGGGNPGFPGGVPPGGGRGGGGGNPGISLTAATPQGTPNAGDKLIGNLPFIFTGD